MSVLAILAVRPTLASILLLSIPISRRIASEYKRLDSSGSSSNMICFRSWASVLFTVIPLSIAEVFGIIFFMAVVSPVIPLKIALNTWSDISAPIRMPVLMTFLAVVAGCEVIRETRSVSKSWKNP